MVLLEFSMYPLRSEGLSPYVARSLNIIDQSGISYQLTPMGTILEGEWEDVMAVVNACFAAMSEDCDRISSHLKIDFRKGASDRLTSKVKSVESKVGRPLSQ